MSPIFSHLLTPMQKAIGLLQDYHMSFLMFGFAYLAAVLCRFKVDSTRPLVMDGLKSGFRLIERMLYELTIH
jgi:hypothetical protein